jgi:hypothetical protein
MNVLIVWQMKTRSQSNPYSHQFPDGLPYRQEVIETLRLHQEMYITDPNELWRAKDEDGFLKAKEHEENDDDEVDQLQDDNVDDNEESGRLTTQALGMCVFADVEMES